MNMRSFVALALLGLLSMSARAQDDYAWQWPIELPPSQDGAYRIELAPEVYGASVHADLRDVQVLDATGTLVASQVFPAPALPPPDLRTQDLAWFPIPAPRLASTDGLSIAVEQSDSGTLTTASIRNVTAPVTPGVAATAGWLIDRGAQAGRLRTLAVTWADTNAQIDARFRLEGSDDLRHWQLLDPGLWLLQLRNEDRELRTEATRLDTSLRYLRLAPLKADAALLPRSFHGTASTQTEPTGWRWLDVAASADEGDGYHYELRGRYPIERVDVTLPPNSNASWSLAIDDTDFQRANGKAHPTLLASNWNTWNLVVDGTRQQSPALTLAAPTSKRQWRLVPQERGTPATAPTLRLGYRAGGLVFLAQGQPPYTLVAGQARARATRTSLAPMLEAVRARNGAQWQPANAQLGTMSERAGVRAYTPTPRARDWKSVLLWTLLVAGTLLVTGFALSLLRRSRDPADPT
ncbi:MAG: DUF3999 domain-containing protein [Dokdonella sp.]|uniref:DUF3999 family protein n=1 Tax=Dokdonella sp. TaxID=2291710 RepID=UPI0025BFC0BC|nr:DUF3999 family protein [Dokdonella sp.]MBZ0222594.1 DUF3999 domain-containing protein [Dokdonella sp.]MCC7254797.1 DUF3999 domain-containing protein [Dokdonella sp.]